MANDIELFGFEELERRLNPRHAKNRLERRVQEATRLNSQIAASAIVRSINSGQYAANSPLTVAMKGSGRPLVDRGVLVQSIEGRAASWDEAVAGILQTRPTHGSGGKSKDLLTVAKVLHFGATITVTPKMRSFLAAMSHRHPGKYFPLKPTTTVVVIPPRPFLQSALTDAMLSKYQANWMKAIQDTMDGRG